MKRKRMKFSCGRLTNVTLPRLPIKVFFFFNLKLWSINNGRDDINVWFRWYVYFILNALMWYSLYSTVMETGWRQKNITKLFKNKVKEDCQNRRKNWFYYCFYLFQTQKFQICFQINSNALSPICSFHSNHHNIHHSNSQSSTIWYNDAIAILN